MEEFKDLDAFYAVSNKGNVLSKRYNKILKPHYDSKKLGYKYITLNYKGIKKSYQIHRLVASLFIPNPNNLPCVNHKDENPSNNNVENLEWCTHSYNLKYGLRYKKEIETKIKNKTCNAPKEVIQFDLVGNVINVFKSANEASIILNIPNTHIIDCCNKTVKYYKKNNKIHSYVTRTVKGFKFSWKNEFNRNL